MNLRLHQTKGSALELLLLLGVCVVLQGCDRETETSLSSSATEAAGPRIEFDGKRHDLGIVGLRGGVGYHRFGLRNGGDEALGIKQVRSSCGCTATTVSQRSLAPGDRGWVEVSVSINPTSAGKGSPRIVERAIYVESNDPAEPVVKLTLSATRLRRHFVYPARVEFTTLLVTETSSATVHYVPRDVPEGNSSPTVTTTAPYVTASIAERVFAQSPFPAALDAVRDGVTSPPLVYPRTGFVINVDLLGSAPAGTARHYVRLITGQPDEKPIMIPVAIQVREPLSITPRRAFLGLIERDGIARRTVEVSSVDGRAFTISSASSREGMIAARPVRKRPDCWEIPLVFDARNVASGAFRDILDLQSDYPTMERFSIGVYGRVRKTAPAIPRVASESAPQ